MNLQSLVHFPHLAAARKTTEVGSRESLFTSIYYQSPDYPIATSQTKIWKDSIFGMLLFIRLVVRLD